MPTTPLRFLLIILAVFLQAAPALAGPAYRVAAPSNPQEDNWLRREGFSITFQVDEARCKKEYGANAPLPPLGRKAALWMECA